MEKNNSIMEGKSLIRILLLSFLGLVLILAISYLTEQLIFVILYLIIVAGYCLKPRFSGLKEWMSSLINLGLKATTFLLLLMVFRAFVYDVYRIPSSSMEQSLHIGDKIIVKKHLGSIIEARFKKLPYNAEQRPMHDDVYVFFPPYSKRTAYVKRVIGLPGDTISCYKNQLYVNNLQAKTYSSYQWRYRLLTPKDMDIKTVLGELLHRRVAVQTSNDPQKFFAFISSTESKILQEAYPEIAQWRVNIKSKKPSRSYPWSHLLAGSFDNFGPVTIPQKGSQINLTPENIAWYADVIQQENANVYTEDSLVLINNHPVTTYTFKHNYYFMMGDNRHASLDSRKWGFVPEEHLIGKVLKIVRNWKLLNA